jgi:polyisoprenoid-binding protein YceI
MTTTSSAIRTYAIDPAHSNIQFSVRHLMIAKVRGSFSKISGTLQLPAESPIPTAVSAVIDVSSIDTRDEQRDGHLKSGDFFEVEKFPEMRFASTKIEVTGPTHFALTGDLELHGVTKSVTLTAEVSGQGKDPWGNHRVAFEATGKVNRKDFGLVWNQSLDAGGVAIGDEISITLDIESVPIPG